MNRSRWQRNAIEEALTFMGLRLFLYVKGKRTVAFVLVSQRTLAFVNGRVEIINIDDMNFGEWVEAEVTVDGERCLPFQFTRRVWNEIRSNEEKLLTFLYQFGKSMNVKCGTYRNPLPQAAVEEAA